MLLCLVVLGWSSPLPEVSRPKREGLIVTTEHAIPLFCCVLWPLFFCLIYSKLCTTYLIFRGNLLCGPICFSIKREKRSKSIVQSPQVSPRELTQGRVHCSKLAWTWEEECNCVKSMQDFHCICLLISHSYFESFIIIVKMLHCLDKID